MNRVYPDSEAYELESNFVLGQILHENKYRFLINGHTHEPMVRCIQGLTIINVGSLCRQDRPVCSVVDFDEGTMQFFEVRPHSVARAELVPFSR